MMRRFKAEGRRRRHSFKLELQQEWESQVAPRFDQENDVPDGAELMDEEIAFDAYLHQRLSRFDDDLQLQKEDFVETLSRAALPGSRLPDGMSDATLSDATRDVLLQQRIDELWAGLRRVYFGEVEDPDNLDDKEPSAKKPRTRENVAAFKREIADTRERLRKFGPRLPDTFDPPILLLPPRRDTDEDDDPNPILVIAPSDTSNAVESDSSLPRDVSNIILLDAPSDSSNAVESDSSLPRDVSNIILLVAPSDTIAPSDTNNAMESDSSLPRDVSDGESVNGESMNGEENLRTTITYGLSVIDLENGESVNGEDNPSDHDKYEAAGEIQPHPSYPSQTSGFDQPKARDCILENGEFVNGEEINSRFPNGYDPEEFNQSKRKLQTTNFGDRKILSVKTMRRILNFKESLMKYGVFVPKNDNEADNSPEHVRWSSGRQLEWMRLQTQGTFERNWDWVRVHKKFPLYQKCDVGHVFFVYDYKYSGEHRVRLVFDGSRQNPETYTDTYAPTGRGESVRLFHIFGVEEGWEIAQYDVPQAFLKSKIDCVIFVYPPRNFAEFPGQLLKLNLSLYGAKQSAALWNKLIDAFLREIGFTPSPMDPCLYKRKDALIILFVDDLRVAALPTTLVEIHSALFAKFQITTSDGTRFLGMDTIYDVKKGYLKLHMETYIVSIHERFHSFDLSRGVPFREIVGCLLWVCLCVMGPELLRVKDLARLSNEYTEADFKTALKVLDRIYLRRTHGIVIVRGGAGTELVPTSSRQVNEASVSALMSGIIPNDDVGTTTKINDLREKALYKVKDEIADVDIRPVILPLNKRYCLIIYSDASFAIGETKQSVSGFVVYLNGTPLLWGSLKQTIVVDSSCSAEYVAASIACKQAIHAENMIGSLGFSCTKPYVMYTDSTACLSIATNALRLGNVRHLAIRYNLVRCYVTIGEITMRYCVTEEMVADLLTKIVVGAQDDRLTIRFYNLCPSGTYYVINHF
jgi:hypothetical protein